MDNPESSTPDPGDGSGGMDESTFLGLVFGIPIAGAVLIAIAVVVGVVIWRRKKLGIKVGV